MKSTIIISAFALASSALASAVELPNANLAARLIDPATMDPTRFSVLSVLKTAIPTSPNAPMPTGDYVPEWYQKLPEDVKSLLPALYPVAAVAASEASVGESQTPESNTYTDATMYAPSATASTLTLYSGLVPNSTVPASGSGSLATASATATNFPSAGSRVAVKTETLAVVAWVGVGVGFFLFA